VTDYYYRDDSTDSVFILILDSFYQKYFYRGGLKNWTFYSLQLFFVARN
jgi:hypothetical protein